MTSDIALVSLFAGVGGFDLAASNIGIPTIAAVEIDDHARGVLKHRFPTTKLFTDVKEVTGSDLRAGFMGRVVLCGGFPCQDLSIAGKRAGLAGGRSGLFWEIIRIAQEIDAEAIVLENVPGLISSNSGRDFGTVIGALAELGYRIGWRVLDAQHFGVPQRRRRIFIIATRVGTDALAEILFECESGGRNPETGDETRTDAAADIADGARTGGGIGIDIVGALTSNMAGGGGGADDNTAQAGHLVARMVSFGEYEIDDVSSTLKSRDHKDATDLVVDAPVLMRQREGKNGGGKGPLLSPDVSLTIATNNDQVLFDNEQMVAAYDEFNDAIGDTHHTLRAGTKQSTGAVVGTVVRRLTPMECERLQGFPDNWTTHRYDFKKNTVVEQADSARYKQMGNAVAVPVVQWLLTRLAAALDA